MMREPHSDGHRRVPQAVVLGRRPAQLRRQVGTTEESAACCTPPPRAASPSTSGAEGDSGALGLADQGAGTRRPERPLRCDGMLTREGSARTGTRATRAAPRSTGFSTRNCGPTSCTARCAGDDDGTVERHDDRYPAVVGDPIAELATPPLDPLPSALKLSASKFLGYESGWSDAVAALAPSNERGQKRVATRVADSLHRRLVAPRTRAEYGAH